MPVLSTGGRHGVTKRQRLTLEDAANIPGWREVPHTDRKYPRLKDLPYLNVKRPFRD